MKLLFLDIPWLAGLIEGEGSFRWHHRSPAITIQMTDEDIITRVAKLWDRPVYGPYGPYGQSKKQTWQTMVTGPQAIGWMFTLYSFMGARRKQKIEEIVAEWKTRFTIQKDRKPTCHPEKKHAAKGLCHECYMKSWHKENKNPAIIS